MINMNICTKAFAIFWLIAGCNLARRSPREINDNTGYIEGFVTHGINNLNGKPFVDLGESLGFGFIYSNAEYETQVLNENGPNAILPDSTINRDGILSTGKWLTEWAIGLGFDITVPDDLFNIPLLDLGTTTPSSTNIDERSQLSSFDENANGNSDPSDVFPSAYFPSGMLTEPTLGDWEKASGLAEINCNADGNALIEITVCNMLPSSLYTIWEVGVRNPGPDETMYYLPAGGVGNVIRTNLNGFGELTFEMPWCPLRECIPNTSKDCQIYFSVYYHNDYIVWGGDVAGLVWKPISYPSGVAGSNHLWFPIHGDILQQPLNRYHKSRCNKQKNLSNRYKQYK